MGRLSFIIAAIGSACLSFFSVWLTEYSIGQRIALIGDRIGLQKSYNDGIAWGIELGMFQNALILLAIIVVTKLALQAKSKLSQVGFGLIVGGGLANIIDRLHDGLVTDVFQVGSFPIFNLADSFITVGVMLLFLDVWRESSSKK